jgi:imidazolonepropionase-like amidohydrolase
MTRTAIKIGNLIDGVSDEVRTNAVVVLDDNRIVEVGGKELLSSRDVVLDLSDKYVVPGLIDLHNHVCSDGDPVPNLGAGRDPNMTLLRATRNARRLLRAGVTTIREAGGPAGLTYSIKAAVNEGIIEGPRCFISGIPLSMTGGHGWTMALEVDGADEARKGAREQMKRGADVLKLLATGGIVTPGEEIGEPQMTLEEMRAAVQVVHDKGRRVMAHAMGPVGVSRALEAGVDTIEHGVWFGKNEIDEMKRRGAWLVPTFSVNWTQSQHGKELGMQPHVIRKSTQAAKDMFRCAEEARKAGVKIAMGTDAGGAGVNHTMVALELELMLKSGACATPMDVIKSATSRGADALGKLDELGTIEAGKFADLIALDRDPTSDITAFRTIAVTIKDGLVVHRAS